MPFLLLFISFFRFVLLSTSYIIPQYLTTVQNYRAIEIGGVLKWIALPQFLSAPAVATILRFVDARFVMALGFALVGCACFMAGQLTKDWVGVDFLPSQLVQAVGQSFALTSIVWFALKHLRPTEIFTFGAILQTGRLFGAQLGTAFVQTFVRTREQTYSNLIGLHVNAGSLLTDQRLDEYARAVAGRSTGQPEAAARATALLARSVQNQAYVLAYIDGFMILGFAVIGAVAAAAAARPTRDRADSGAEVTDMHERPTRNAIPHHRCRITHVSQASRAGVVLLYRLRKQEAAS
jgi:DHA2 family multidrug resistance protein